MLSNSNKILFYILFLHLTLWTVIPSIINTNLPLDTIEALAWGNELKLGYDKYPPVFPLFTELFYKLFGNQDWSYYLLSQIFVTSSFLVVFYFSKYFLENNLHSLISVLLLETIYFFNYTTPELNAFIPLFLFLATTAFFSWRAINFNRNLDWIMFGIFAGICTLTFYLSLYILASLALFFIGEIFIKKRFNYKYFFALFAYLLIISPHLYFIFFLEADSIRYAIFRSFGDPLSSLKINYSNHLIYPIIFLVKQFLILLPLFIFLSLLVNNFKIKINFKDKKLIFLFTITFLPIILMFLTSVIGGVRIRTMWMTTFYVFPGIFFVYLFKSQIQTIKFKRFFIYFLLVFFTLPIVYGLDSFIQKDKRTDFPGKKIARKIQNTWDNNFSNEIEFVAGKGWVYGGWYAGNLSYQLKNRPKLIYGINKEILNYGLIKIDKLNSINSCQGILLKIEPYFDSCMIGKVK
ncbi:MAG: glycosyltransferase family 39 protein [Pelagibacteraceae bacterium]